MWQFDPSEQSLVQSADIFDLAHLDESPLSEMEPCLFGVPSLLFRSDFDSLMDDSYCTAPFGSEFDFHLPGSNTTLNSAVSGSTAPSTEPPPTSLHSTSVHHHHHHYHHHHHHQLHSISILNENCVDCPSDGPTPLVTTSSCVPSSTGSSAATSPLLESPTPPTPPLPKSEASRERVRIRTRKKKKKNMNTKKSPASSRLRRLSTQSQEDAECESSSPTRHKTGHHLHPAEKRSAPSQSASDGARATSDSHPSKHEHEIVMRPFENMKTTQLRHELCVRRAPIYGTKHELLERLRLTILGPGSIPNDSPPLTAAPSESDKANSPQAPAHPHNPQEEQVKSVLFTRTTDTLRGILRSFGKPIYGNKEMLIGRLMGACFVSTQIKRELFKITDIEASQQQFADSSASDNDNSDSCDSNQGSNPASPLSVSSQLSSSHSPAIKSCENSSDDEIDADLSASALSESTISYPTAITTTQLHMSVDYSSKRMTRSHSRLTEGNEIPHNLAFPDAKRSRRNSDFNKDSFSEQTGNDSNTESSLLTPGEPVIVGSNNVAQFGTFNGFSSAQEIDSTAPSPPPVVGSFFHSME